MVERFERIAGFDRDAKVVVALRIDHNDVEPVRA